MGEASILKSDSGQFTWKKSKDRETTDWKAIAESLGATPEQVAAHTTSKEGARVFRTPFSTSKA